MCSFLVRPSDNTPGDYSLFFRTSEIIQRFKISPTPNNQYMMGGRYYNRYVWQRSNLKLLLLYDSRWIDSRIVGFETRLVYFDSFSHRQCWWHHRPLQERANRWGLQPERARFRAGEHTLLPLLIFVSVMCDSQVVLFVLFAASGTSSYWHGRWQRNI